jgi:predicted NAD/FAD-binding protein
MPAQGKGPIVVAGAGLAGLSAAVRLASKGTSRKIVVLEATANGGGRSRPFDHGPSGYELDNGQHLMMGCYFETLAFLRTLGRVHCVEFQRNMAVDMVQPGGRRVTMRCPALPAPLHLGAGLLGMRGMGLLHKASALRAGLLLKGEVDRPDDNETCDAWLRRLGQTQAIRNAFWEPLVWSTLNDDPLVSSAAMLMAVLERAFLGTRDASTFGLPKVPLSKLYDSPAVRYLADRGVDVRTASPVRGIETGSDGVEAVVLRSGERIETDTVISALPPKPLLHALPDAVLRDPVFA